MALDYEKAFNDLMRRLQDEIRPLFEKVVSKYGVPLSESGVPNSSSDITDEIGRYLTGIDSLLHEQQRQAGKSGEDILQLQQELKSALDRLHAKEKEIQEIMITDELTTLFNRQHLKTVLEDEIARCRRYGRPLALIMIDIDEFKNFNDLFGHKAGDKMLTFIGSLIKDNTRAFDRAFRYGGEEFVVVLPESDLTMAYIVSERIRRGFECKSFSVDPKEGAPCESVSRTVSIGVTATFAFGTQDVSVEELIGHTETALLHAKEKGGNVCVRQE